MGRRFTNAFGDECEYDDLGFFTNAFGRHYRIVRNSGAGFCFILIVGALYLLVTYENMIAAIILGLCALVSLIVAVVGIVKHENNSWIVPLSFVPILTGYSVYSYYEGGFGFIFQGLLFGAAVYSLVSGYFIAGVITSVLSIGLVLLAEYSYLLGNHILNVLIPLSFSLCYGILAHTRIRRCVKASIPILMLVSLVFAVYRFSSFFTVVFSFLYFRYAILGIFIAFSISALTGRKVISVAAITLLPLLAPVLEYLYFYREIYGFIDMFMWDSREIGEFILYIGTVIILVLANCYIGKTDNSTKAFAG